MFDLIIKCPINLLSVNIFTMWFAVVLKANDDSAASMQQ